MTIAKANERILDNIFGYLDEHSKEAFSHTCQRANKEFLSLEEYCWKVFSKQSRLNFTVFITDETGLRRQDSVSAILGGGGSKNAWQLEENQALLAPAYGCKRGNWKQYVNQEVGISNFFTSIGLLTALSKKVRVSLPNGGPGSFVAYVSVSFEGLGGLKGCYVIDTKNKDSNTWIKGRDFIFKEARDRFVLENWDPVFDNFLTDIAKICAHGIRLPRDAMNYAVVKLPDVPGRKCGYEVCTATNFVNTNLH